MKNYTALVVTVAILVGTGLGLSSCKEDEPPVPPKLSFAESAMTVNEDAGVIEVELVLDKAHGRDLNVEYNLAGTASDQDAVGSANADYEVRGTHGVVVIPSGQTSAAIELEIYSDIAFEEDETIEITIMDVNTSDVEVTAENEIVITIANDDAALALSFVEQSATVNEADGVLQVQLTLDKPAPQNLTLSYAFSGTATDSITAFNNNQNPNNDYLNPDYFVDGTAGQLVIEQGQTTGVIDLIFYSDYLIEDANPETAVLDPETIVITVTPPAGVSMDDTDMTISLEQEDGLLIALFWPDPVGEQKADMDILLRVGPSTSEWLGILTLAAAEEDKGPELMFIPYAVSYQAYGLSYVYWGGTYDPLEFEVLFIDIVDGMLEAEAQTESFAGTYTAANINDWTKDPASTHVAQTFEKATTGFTSPSPLDIPASGSRALPAGFSSRTFGRQLIRRSVHHSFPSRTIATYLNTLR